MSREGEGFLLVYSIARRSTFERVERFKEQILRAKDSMPTPMMLVGNKCDRVTEREVSREEGLGLAKKLDCEFIETSAKTCVNVERAFYQVVRAIRSLKEDGKRKKREKRPCVVA